MHHQPALVRFSMPITVVLMVVLCVLPTGWLDWTGWFAAQARVVVSPIAHPIAMARDLVLPQSVSNPGASDRERTLLSELDRYKTQLYREQQKTARLEELVDQLSSGAALTPEMEIMQVPRPVTGTARDFMVVRTGGIEVVERNTIVVVGAAADQLCGRVTEARDRTCMVLPITAENAEPILGVVMLDETGLQTARCLLRSQGDGTLRGDVTQPAGDAREIVTGMEVRLLDDQWPRHAQMLVVGRIERVSSAEDQPLRKQIVVRPTVDLRSVSEVIFRVPAMDEGMGGGGG